MPISAEEVKTLKAKVKTELLRRCHNGSVSSYGSATYDFATTPVTGNAVLAEQGDKIITPLLAIKDISGLTTPITGQPIPSAFNYNNLNTIITNLAAEPIYGNSSTCKASCTGLCQSGCANTCVGCTGCGGDCAGGCVGTCSFTCTGGCGGTCTGDCVGTCTGDCVGNCTGGCVGGCNATCTDVCTGCGNQCVGTCWGGCYAVCADNCSGGATS